MLTPQLIQALNKATGGKMSTTPTPAAPNSARIAELTSIAQGGPVKAQPTPSPVSSNPIVQAGKTLVDQTNSHAANIVQDLSEKPSLAGASDVIGNVAGEAGDFLGQLFSLGYQATTPPLVKDLISKAGQALVSAHQKSADAGGQPTNQVHALLDKFQVQHPDLYKTIAGLGSGAALAVGAGEGPTATEAGSAIKTGAKTAAEMLTDIPSGIKSAVTASPEVTAQKTLATAVEDATPAYSKRLISEPAIKNADGTLTPRVQEGGLKGRTVTATPLEQRAGQALAQVPNYPAEGTALEKYQAIQPELTAKAKTLTTSLENEHILRPPQQIVKVVRDAVNNVSDESLLLQKSDPVVGNYMRVVDNAVTQNDGTLAGELKVRQALDRAYENARGKLAFGSDKISALDDIHTAARDALNKDIIAHAQTTDVKASLQAQWDLNRAADVLRAKAEAEAGNSIGRFVQNHPIISKVGKGAARAAGVGAGVHLIP